jgi:Fe-S-cluster-containing dehydrogenase component
VKRRYAMALDTRRCVACQGCVLSCKAENNLPPHGFRDWVVQETRGTFPALVQENRSERCNHCGNPACVSACPTGASYVGEGGTVLVNYDKCTGCKACVAACPYDARYVHEEKGYIDKCTFCLHRVQRGREPGCVEFCPTKALTFGDLSDPSSELSRLLRERPHKTLDPQRGLEPHMFFLL